MFALYIIIKIICEVEIPIVMLPSFFIHLPILQISIECPLRFMSYMNYKEALKGRSEKLDIF